MWPTPDSNPDAKAQVSIPGRWTLACASHVTAEGRSAGCVTHSGPGPHFRWRSPQQRLLLTNVSIQP